MKIKIKQEFEGIINNVVISNRELFFIAKEVIEIIEEKYNVNIINENFTKALVFCTNEIYLNSDGEFTYNKLQEEFVGCIDVSNDITNIQFSYNNESYKWGLKELNEIIRYTKGE